MSNSPLVQYTRISPNSNNPRNHKIDKITIHHTAGVISVESLGEIFANPSRQASSNYGIGSDGRIAMFVEEQNRSWCSSSWDNDQRAITIEVSNSAVGGNWLVSDYVLSRLIELCVDICKRNGIERLNFTGDTNGNLTMHRYFADTSCPGDYLASKFPYIAEEVNKRLKTIEIEPIERKSVRLKIDANLWDLTFTNPDNAISVKQFKTGDIIENIVAIAHHSIGMDYYMTEYSYSHRIMNGFNVVDCEDIVDEPPKAEEPKEEPVITPIPTPEPELPKEEETKKEVDEVPKYYENKNNALLWLIEKIVELIKKVFDLEK